MIKPKYGQIIAYGLKGGKIDTNKKPNAVCAGLFMLAERVGFEPTVAFDHTAFRERHLQPLGHLSIALDRGADGRIRTGDLLITNQLLYQLSYISVMMVTLWGFEPQFAP